MKKFVAILLVAVMALASASALAAGSVETPTYTKTDSAALIVVPNGQYADEALKNLQEIASKGDNVLNFLDADVAEKVKSIVGEDVEANELVSLDVVGEPTGPLYCDVNVATPYEKGTKVAIVLCIVNGGNGVAQVLEGEVVDEGVVRVTCNLDQLNAIKAADETYAIFVSAK